MFPEIGLIILPRKNDSLCLRTSQSALWGTWLRDSLNVQMGGHPLNSKGSSHQVMNFLHVGTMYKFITTVSSEPSSVVLWKALLNEPCKDTKGSSSPLDVQETVSCGWPQSKSRWRMVRNKAGRMIIIMLSYGCYGTTHYFKHLMYINSFNSYKHP